MRGYVKVSLGSYGFICPFEGGERGMSSFTGAPSHLTLERW